MDLSFSAKERAFEQEVRDFIAKNLTPEMKRATALTPSVFSDPDIGMAWQRALHKNGWGAPGWPVEYGGPDWTPAQRWIFEAECARAGTPNVNVMGVKMVGPVIIGFGSPEQKNFYLPRILSGEDYWCQGYSEPGAGSDLSSLKTRAVRDGDDYIVNGTKIWTTHAHHANRMFALVRTNDTPRQQDGISFILIDMKSPGITTRPILTIGGDHEVNQVFFDDVRVPVHDRLDELRILLGVVFEVGILDQHDLAARFGNAAADGGTLSLVDGLQDVADLGPLLCESGDDVARPVGGAVVDDYDLLLDRHFADAAQQFRNGRPLVVAGDDHGKQRRLQVGVGHDRVL